MKFVRDSQTLDVFRKHIIRRNTWYEEMTTKFINIKVNNRYKRLPEHPETIKEVIEPIQPHRETPKKITVIQSTQLTKNPSNPLAKSQTIIQTNSQIQIPTSPKIRIPTSPKVKIPTSPNTRPISLTMQTTQDFLNSKKFFASSSMNPSASGKNLKYGLAYQKHQERFKKLFANDKDESSIKAEKRIRNRIVVPSETMSALASTLHSKDTSIMFRKPSSAKPKSLALTLTQSYHKLNGSDILGRRLSTDDNDRTDILGSYPSTPGLKISSLTLPNHYSLRTEPGLRGYYLGSIDTGFNLANIKKIPSSSIFIQESDRDHIDRDSLQELTRSRTIIKTKTPVKRNSYFEHKSPTSNVSIPLYTSVSAFPNNRKY